MKTLIKQISIITAVIFLASCSETEKVTDELQASTERGTVIKTLETNLRYEVAEDNLISITGEVIDQRSQDFEKIDVFLSFKDRRDVDDEIATDDFFTREEALFETFLPGDLDNSGEYPLLNFDFTGDEFDAFFGIDAVDYVRGGVITIRMELVMNNGTVFTSTNVNSVVSGGAFYLSPFQYTSKMICQPSPPAEGVWTLDLQDEEGDGWSGAPEARVKVTIDGVESTYTLTDGEEAIETFTVPPGTQVLSVEFVSGEDEDDEDDKSDEEVSFRVLAPPLPGETVGATIVNTDTDPLVGIELIDYCALDYRANP